MIALVRFQLAAMLHGQRYLAPVLLHLSVLSIFTVNDIGPLTGSYVVVAGSLLVAACWLTITVLNQEDPTRRAVSIVTAGGPGRLLTAETTLALLAGFALLLVGTVFPIVAGDHLVTPAAVFAGVLAQATSLCTGVAVGLLCSRLLVPRPGWSLLLALLVIGAIPLTPGLSPINPMLKLLSTARPPAALLPALVTHLAVAAALLAAATLTTDRLSRRRS
ncbi:hypothetical protein [Symbioplanes lichenis]|uniref:hypothetical protein n=1 Tax=Symbioplanes lichenis TaxID=1629072 RepID=UPI002738188F|nr:hypothetical protein [Actinoplanes lichenis]